MNINTINIESITQKPHDPTRITATRKRNFAPFGQNKKPSKKQKIEHSSMNQTAAVEQINEKIYTELDHLIKLQNEKYSEDRSSKLKDITSKII